MEVSGQDRAAGSNLATRCGDELGGPARRQWSPESHWHLTGVSPIASDRTSQTQLISPLSEDNSPMHNELTPTSAESDLSVLLIDDDTELCDLVREFFTAPGIRLTAIHDGRRGLAEAFDRVYDLILLDVMLPGLDGFELLRQLRGAAMCRSSF